MHKTLLISAAIFGMLAVALGAFGAHGLSAHLSENSMQTFQTANRYHFYHVFAMLITGLLIAKDNNRFITF